MEKEQYSIRVSSDKDRDPESLARPHVVETATGALQEASELYGDQAAAEEYGYVNRGSVSINCLTYTRKLIFASKTQVKTHPVHSARRDYRHWLVPWYRQRIHTSWSSLRSAWVLVYWSCDLWHDAMSW